MFSAIGHSVIRGLVTAGQWSAVNLAVYLRESKYIYNVNIGGGANNSDLRVFQDPASASSVIFVMQMKSDNISFICLVTLYDIQMVLSQALPQRGAKQP